MKPSRCFIRTDSSASNAVCLQSLCNPTLKLANFLAASHHLRLCLSTPLFSSPLLHTAILWGFFKHLSILTSFSALRTIPSLPRLHSLPPLLPFHDLLPKPQGLTQLWNTRCSINDFAPRPRSAREIQLPFSNRVRILTPATPLCNMCESKCKCVRCAQTFRRLCLQKMPSDWLHC